jgi:Beta-propeller repeat
MHLGIHSIRVDDCCVMGWRRPRPALTSFLVGALVAIAPWAYAQPPEAAMPVLTQKVAPAVHTLLISGYGKLPINFEPNVGQASPTVKYLARGDGYSVGLTERGAILSLRQVTTGKPSQSQASRTSRPAPAAQSLLRLSLAHANARPRMRAEQRQDSVSNYFIGNDQSKWHSKVVNYRVVRYEQVYPGIDWVMYGNPQRLEYDLIVAPHADARQIKLQFEGEDSLALADNGDLLVKVQAQTLRQLKPVIYQIAKNGEKHSISGRYVLDHQQVAFHLGDYDHNRRLIIDPVLAYSTYLGGSGADAANSIAVDSAGNAYVAGYTISTDFPTASPLQGAKAGSAFIGNAFVSKFNATGNALVYSTYLGGSGNNFAFGIAVDSAGNAYVAGSTYSTDFPTVNPLQGTNPNAANGVAFVAKINAAGSALLYSTYLGGTGGDNANAIAVDSAGNAYVVGDTVSTDFPSAGPLQAANAGNGDAFVTKFNATGSALLYSTYLGGSGLDSAAAIAVDSAGNAYVAGSTSSINFPTANPMQGANAATGGDTNAFVSKLNAAGNLLAYSTYLGGSTGDSGLAIAVDGSGDAYVAGETRSVDFPTANAFQSLHAGPSGILNAFVTKFNAAGSALLYSTFLGGGGDIAHGIAVDSAGSAYVAGETISTSFPTSSPLQGTLAGARNAFVTKFNAAGSTLLYSTYLGGNSSDIAQGIAVDSAGSAYVAGQTNSTNFPTANPFQGARAGGGIVSPDAFVTKITGPAAPSPTVTIIATPTSIIVGQSSTLTWSSTNATSCTASGAWSGTEPVTGTQTLTPSATGSGVYTLTCTGSGGSANASASLTTNAAPTPTVTIAVNPTAITVGQSAVLTWSSTNATSCAASGTWSGAQTINGSLNESPTVAGTETFTLTCSGTSSTAVSTATLSVAAAPAPSAANLTGKSGAGGLGLDSLLALGLLVAWRLRRVLRIVVLAALALLGLALPATAQNASPQWQFNWNQSYIGIRVGSGVYSESSARLDADLAGAGETGTTTVVHQHRIGGVFYAGVPVYRALSLELGFADLGTYPVDISTTSANIPQLAQTLVRKLEPAGRGVTSNLAAPLDINSWLAIEPRFGLLVYQSKQEVSTTVGTFSHNRVGAGIDAGLALLLHPTQRIYIGAGVDCFDTDGRCNVLLYSAEIEYHFGKRSGAD